MSEISKELERACEADCCPGGCEALGVDMECIAYTHAEQCRRIIDAALSEPSEGAASELWVDCDPDSARRRYHAIRAAICGQPGGREDG